MGDEGAPPLLNKHKPPLSRSGSHAYDELQSFRAWLKWMFVDQSSVYTTLLSWFMYLLFAIIVPFFSYFGLACADCDSEHSRPFDKVVQLSLTGIATLSFLCLSRFVSRYGLRRFLFFDRLCDESETVRKGYTDQLNRSLKILFVFVIPCFVAECAYKIWWYSSGGTRVPFLGNVFVSDLVACILESVSWLYRTVVFFLVCVLFRMICYLQILRLHDFAKVFNMDSNVEIVLQEHLRIRRHLRIISHRYRVFISLALIVITASQFSSLLMTTRSSADLNIFKSGELALCSVSLLAGLLIILRSATRITHKAQAVTSLAAKWHVCATIDSFDSGVTTPLPQVGQQQSFPTVTCNDPLSDTEEEDFEDEEDELDNTKIVPAYAYSTISFQKRQALVTYFENNRAGITVYGWMLDRTTLHTIFGLELSLVLWLLGKTIDKALERRKTEDVETRVSSTEVEYVESFLIVTDFTIPLLHLAKFGFATLFCCMLTVYTVHTALSFPVPAKRKERKWSILFSFIYVSFTISSTLGFKRYKLNKIFSLQSYMMI